MRCFVTYYDCLGHTEATQILSKWGLTLHPSPIKLEGPVYKREQIIFGVNPNKKDNYCENTDWGMDMVRNAMFTAVSIIVIL